MLLILFALFEAFANNTRFYAQEFSFVLLYFYSNGSVQPISFMCLVWNNGEMKQSSIYPITMLQSNYKQNKPFESRKITRSIQPEVMRQGQSNLMHRNIICTHILIYSQSICIAFSLFLSLSLSALFEDILGHGYSTSAKRYSEIDKYISPLIIVAIHFAYCLQSHRVHLNDIVPILKLAEYIVYVN